MGRIHVIHVVESSKRQSWFEKLVNRLSQNSISQSVVTLERAGDLNDFLSQIPLQVFSPSGERLVSVTLQVVKMVRQARKKDSINFLLLHGHKASLIGLLSARVAKLDYGIVHHVQPKYFQLLRSRYPVRGFVHQFIYQYYVRQAKIIQSLSKEVTKSLTASGYEPKRIVAVGHGIDFEAFQKSAESIANEAQMMVGFPRILMVGRLAWEKNYPLAIEVFAKLLKSFPEAHLLIAGSGPAENEIKALTERFNVSDNVSLLGRVENVSQLMVQSDLLMHFALTESYGQVYIEACLTGLPIFTFPAGIAIDLSEESDSLIHLLTKSDPEWISQQICKFLDSSPKRQPPNFAFMRNHYRKHDQEEVFQEISKYLLRLIPELDQEGNESR